MWFVNWPDGEVANDAPALPPRPCMNWKGSPEEVKDLTSWWWLLLSSENKTLWIGKLAHLIPGGDWSHLESELQWLLMITYHPKLSMYRFLAVLGKYYSNSEGFMTDMVKFGKQFLKATFTKFCDLPDIRTKARLSLREIIMRAVKRDQTSARRL